MGKKFVSWIIILHLLVILSYCGSRASELAGTENKEPISEEHHETSRTTGHTHNHMDHIDPSVMVFFTLKDLKIGKRMPIHFPKRNLPNFWPREKADSLPFSFNQLPSLLKHFSFSPNSPQAKAMEDTLKECESKSIEGEVKFCATSLESMLDFTTQTILGVKSNSNNRLQLYITSHITKSSVTFQNYTILENIMRIEVPTMVACHTMPYPYAVFYCHSQKSENRIYRVPLVGDNGDKVEAMVVCHMDTSHWGSGHVSFQILDVTPGSSSVCHFFPADHLIWVPKVKELGVSHSAM